MIAIYAEAVTAHIPDAGQKRRAITRAERLLDFFDARMLDQINGESCRAYAAWRGNQGGARRDLQDLSAAIGHHLAEGYHREIIKVVLPPRGRRRERWLSRDELARLVWAAWRMGKIAYPIKGCPSFVRTGKHLARAILFAYYTASRPGDVFRASYHAGAGRSYIDLDAGVFYRLPEGKRETAKRQSPVKLGTRLQGHLRRWKRHCVSYPVEWEGKPVQSVDSSFARAVDIARLGDGVSMYSLRHSRLTNIIQRGCSKEEAAEHGATSVDVIEKHYWHHSPEAQKKAANSR